MDSLIQRLVPTDVYIPKVFNSSSSFFFLLIKFFINLANIYLSNALMFTNEYSTKFNIKSNSPFNNKIINKYDSCMFERRKLKRKREKFYFYFKGSRYSNNEKFSLCTITMDTSISI